MKRIYNIYIYTYYISRVIIVPSVSQLFWVLCSLPNSSNFLLPGLSLSIIPYISSGLCDVSRTWKEFVWRITYLETSDVFITYILYLHLSANDKHEEIDIDGRIIQAITGTVWNSLILVKKINTFKIQNYAFKNSKVVSFTSLTIRSQSRPLLKFLGLPLTPTRQCSLPWFNQWPERGFFLDNMIRLVGRKISEELKTLITVFK